jgi:hypothetical protein
MHPPRGIVRTERAAREFTEIAVDPFRRSRAPDAAQQGSENVLQIVPTGSSVYDTPLGGFPFGGTLFTGASGRVRKD